jgi:hypothetical protein
MGAGTTKVRTTIPASGQHRLMCPESMERSVFHVQSDDPNALASFHDQVEGKVLDEKVGVMTQRLAVEGMQNSVAGTVRCCCASVGLAAFAILEGLAAECALVYFSLFRP